MSWHDNAVHGYRISEGEFGSGEIEFDLDYIVEWMCHSPSEFRFRTAPVLLTFHNASDLKMQIDYVHLGAGLSPFTIAGIEKLAHPRADLPGLFVWKLAVNWPEGEISFSSEGFTQVRYGNIVETAEQCLRPSQRSRTIGAA